MVGYTGQTFPEDNSLFVGKLYNSGTTVIDNVLKNAWLDLPATLGSNPVDIYALRAAGERVGIAIVRKLSAGNGTGTAFIGSGNGFKTISYDGSNWT